MPRFTHALLLVVAAGVSIHCAPKAASTVPDQAPVTTATPAPAVDAPAKACRDWSTLELASLPPLPKAKHITLFEQVWRTVLQRHYDPTLGCLDWPALRESYGARVATAKSDEAAYAAMGEMLAELKQSHLGLIPPSREAAPEPGETRPMGSGHVPIDVMMIGDELLVSKSSWEGKKAPMPPGSTLLAIDDHDLASTIAKATERTPNRRVERDFHLTRAAQAWMSCDAGESRTLTWLAPGKKKPTTKAVACHAPERRRATFGNLREIPLEIETRILPKSTTGYLRFNIWLMDLSPEIERGIADLREKGMTQLVIDLRGNPGGVGAMVVPVGRLLLDRDADLGVMRMRGAEQKFAIKRAEDPFTGPVAILIDAGTASTSEIFAQALKDLGRARVVGTSESQGAALPSLIERLEGGALLQYVVADYTSPAGIAVEGKGVEPDIRVAVTREDLVAGRDPVLAAAIAALTNPNPEK